MTYSSSIRFSLRPAFAVFAAVFLATALYTFTRTKLFEAKATITGIKAAANQTRTTHHSVIESSEEISDTALKVARSTLVLTRVSAKIEGTPLATELSARSSQSKIPEILAAGRAAHYAPENDALIFSFRSTDPVLAAAVANLFAEQTKTWFDQVRFDDVIHDYENLALNIENGERRLKAEEEKLRQLHYSQRPDEAEITRLQLLIPSLRSDIERFKALEKSRDEFERAKRQSPYRFTPAKPPAPDDYVSPNHLRDLGIGLLAGLLAATLAARLRRPVKAVPPPASSPCGH